MSLSTSSDWKETALVAAFAAGFGSMMAFQFLNNNKKKHHDRNDNYYNRSYCNNESSRFNEPYFAASNYHHGPPPITFIEHGGRTSRPFHSNPQEDLLSRDLHSHEDEEDILDSKGWSMAEAMAAAQKESAKTASMTPKEVLQSLQRGNMRFCSGHAHRPEKSAFHRRALISQQFPSTAVLGCSDSRVPVEIVFDQGLGDMFVVRVAGNCLGVTTEASLEYAVHHLNVKVLMVMGHEGCGAIKAAGLPTEQINQEPEALASLLNKLKSGLEKETSQHINRILDARARDREAVATNVAHQVEALAEDPAILAKIEKGELKLVGAFYEISSGIVDFFHLVSRTVPGEEFKPSPGVQSRFNPRTKEIVYA